MNHKCHILTNVIYPKLNSSSGEHVKNVYNSTYMRSVYTRNVFLNIYNTVLTEDVYDKYSDFYTIKIEIKNKHKFIEQILSPLFSEDFFSLF